MTINTKKRKWTLLFYWGAIIEIINRAFQGCQIAYCIGRCVNRMTFKVHDQTLKLGIPEQSLVRQNTKPTTVLS